MHVNKKADAPVQPIRVRLILLELAEAQLRTMGVRLRGTVVFQSVNSTRALWNKFGAYEGEDWRTLQA